jgi:DDE superfamily endonuclease
MTNCTESENFCRSPLRIRWLSRFTCQRRAAMNLEGTEDSASRFAAYVGELTSVIGHADRARPLRDYCAGLVVTEGRRSVEPIAAVTAPCGAPVQHQRLLHFVAEAHPGRTSRCWPKCASWLCRRSSGTDRSRPGLSTIRLFQSAAPSRSACSISIAGSSGSKPIVRW